VCRCSVYVLYCPAGGCADVVYICAVLSCRRVCRCSVYVLYCPACWCADVVYMCCTLLQVGVPMPDSDTVSLSGRPDPNSVEILQHINAMLDSPLDLSEGLPRGSPGDGKSYCLADNSS
jgi:hypothetical protein